MFSVFAFYRPRATAALAALLVSCGSQAVAGPLDDIGVTALRAFDPSLTGTGVNVALAEASLGPDPTNFDRPSFEVRGAAIGQPDSLFTYYSLSGTISGTPPPNIAGSESGHADGVGTNFFGAFGGVAPGVSRVDNYEANYFYTTIINPPAVKPPILARVVNQSFIFTASGGGPLSAADQRVVDSKYDDYIAQYNTIIVSGAGNGGQVHAASTAYNGIGVAVIDGASSVGPTVDNGRSKPDLTAPGGATSFSTPFVSGSATVLVQAGNLERGGVGTAAAATDARTIKVLLLDGAVKPAGWSHTETQPLDPRYGAGEVNVKNSYDDLVAGRRNITIATTNNVGGAHNPPIVSGSVNTARGWDFNTVTSSPTSDAVNHYFFDLNSSADTLFTLTSTLTWFRPLGESNINNLNLFLYSAATNSQVAGGLSISTVDNVEHLFVQGLAPGRYDLQVFKSGGAAAPNNPNVVTQSETYAVAFNAIAVPEGNSILLLLLAALGSVTHTGRSYIRPRRL